MLRSARVRILAAILVVAALGMAAAGVATFLIQRERTLSQIDQRLDVTLTALRAIAAGTADADAGTGTGSEAAPATLDAFFTDAMQRLLPDAHESVVGLVGDTTAYRPRFGSAHELESDPGFLARVTAAADGEHPVVGTLASRWGTQRYLVVPVRIAQDPGTGFYVAAYDLDAELSQVSQAFGSYALLAGGALVLVGVVGWFVAGRALRPVRLVREAAARASEEDLSARIPVRGRDDVSALAVTFNAMLERLERSFGAQRRLLDDVSHELRTPITIVRGHLELLDATDLREVESTRALALEELDRMRSLVEDAATLAKADAPGFLRPEEVDVAALTETVLAKAAALDPARVWTVARTAPILAVLDPGRITQAWLQLAENAVKYATPGTPIELGSRVRGDGRLELWVRDRGPGMPEDQLHRVFERFVRIGDGRGPGGSGLGLSIVAVIAAGHGGTARAERAGDGMRVVIALPAPGEGTTWHAS